MVIHCYSGACMVDSLACLCAEELPALPQLLQPVLKVWVEVRLLLSCVQLLAPAKSPDACLVAAAKAILRVPELLLYSQHACP